MSVKAREYSVKDLVGDTMQEGHLRRFDIFINYMAIENHYGKNECGWRLYEKYEKGSGRNPLNSKNKFIGLINSFEENGFLKRYPLLISAKGFLHVRNGAHRLASAMYFGCDSVTGRIKNCNAMSRLTNVNSALLLKRRFEKDEIKIIRSKQKQIFKEMRIDNE